MGAHMRESSTWTNALIFLLTPMPCLALTAILDCIALEPPEKGVATSSNFWMRAFCVFVVISITELAQLQAAVPVLQLNTKKVLIMALVSATVSVAASVGLANWIGYPVPFLFQMASPVWLLSTVIGFTYFCGAIVRGNAQVWTNVKSHLIIVVCQMLLVMIYPMYTYLFASLSSEYQTAFMLPLPFLKIASKNVISYFMADMHDMKPEFVIFNIEIFNALFVSLCMQRSTSAMTPVALMLVDFAQAWLALHDMKELIRDLDALLAKMPTLEGQPRLNIVEAALKVIEKDSNVAGHPSFQAKSRQHEYLLKSMAEISRQGGYSSGTARLFPVGPFTSARVAAAPKEEEAMQSVVSPETTAASAPERTLSEPVPSKTMRPSLRSLDNSERLQLVQNVVKVLFMTEYAVLIEYTEVATPVVYSTYRPTTFAAAALSGIIVLTGCSLRRCELPACCLSSLLDRGPSPPEPRVLSLVCEHVTISALQQREEWAPVRGARVLFVYRSGVRPEEEIGHLHDAAAHVCAQDPVVDGAVKILALGHGSCPDVYLSLGYVRRDGFACSKFCLWASVRVTD